MSAIPFNKEQININEVVNNLVNALAVAVAEKLSHLTPTVLPKAEPDYYNVEELCGVLKCKRQRVYDLACKGEIPYYKDGKRLVFKRSEFEKWREARLQRVPASYA